MGDSRLQKVCDDLSVIYDQGRSKRYFKNSLEIILNNVPPKSTVFEVGCGTGMYCIELAKRGYKVKGFDYSEKMIKKAIENMEKEGVEVDFVVADAQEEIPFKDKFDCAISMDSWEFFPKPVDVLNNVYHSLTEEGRFIIVTPNPYFAPLIILAEKLKVKKLAPAYAYFNSFKHRIRKWARNTKFEIEKIEHSFYFVEYTFYLKKLSHKAEL